MPSANFIQFDRTIGNLGAGNIRLGVDTIKAYLSDVAPDKAADQYKSDLAEIAAGNGYVAGGVALTSVTWTQEAGSPQGFWLLSAASFQFAASGGDIAQARYCVLYALGVGSPNEFLLGYADYGSEFTITNGNTLTVSDPNGILEIGPAPGS